MSELKTQVRDYFDHVVEHVKAEDVIDDSMTSAVVGRPGTRPLPRRAPGWVLAVAAAVVIVLIGLGGYLLQMPGDAAQNSTPSTTTGTVDHPHLATADVFMTAWDTGDVATIVSTFAPDGKYNTYLPLAIAHIHDWYRAVGMETSTKRCTLLAPAPDDSRYRLSNVSCGYTYENDLTKALDSGPVAGVVQFEIDDRGVIQALDAHSFDASFTTWYRFSEWVSSEHPDDFERMFISQDSLKPQLGPSSAALWERYVDEFVASPEVTEPAPGELTEAAYGAQVIKICAVASIRFAIALSELGPPNPYLGENPAAHEAAVWISEEALADLRAMLAPPEMSGVYTEVFPLMEEEIEVDRQLAVAAAAGDSELVEELTRQRVDLTHEKDHVAGHYFWYCPVNLGA